MKAHCSTPKNMSNWRLSHLGEFAGYLRGVPNRELCKCFSRKVLGHGATKAKPRNRNPEGFGEAGNAAFATSRKYQWA